MKWKKSAYGFQAPSAPQRSPTDPAARIQSLLVEGNYVEARLLLEQLVRAQPADFELRRTLASVCASLGDGVAAMAALNLPVVSAADRARLSFERGVILEFLKRADEAADAYLDAVLKLPDQPASYINATRLLAELGRTEEAEELASKGLATCKFGLDALRIRQALLLPVIYQSAEQVHESRDLRRRRLQALLERPGAVSDPITEIGAPDFFLTYQGENDVELANLMSQVVKAAVPDIDFNARPTIKRSGGRIRLVVMSSHFREHTVARVSEGLIRGLPRDRFEVIVARPLGGDALTKQIDAAADRIQLLAGDYRLARQQIAALSPDVLLYTDIGMEPLSYALAFSRLAKVQCVAWGHPDTTAIPNVDYYLSAAPFEPEGGQGAYSERLVRLGRIYCDMPRPILKWGPLPRAMFDLPEGVPLYLCAQSPFKLHPDFDPVVRQILERDSDGLVLLSSGPYAHWSEVLRERLRANLGDLAARVRMIPRVDPADFQRLLAMADALIDPLHFTGGYSSYLAFAANLPVVTWRGQFFRGRMTSGLYRQMGLDSLIADDPGAFVELAVRLANDTAFREEQISLLAARSHLLFNDRESISELAAFLEAAVTAADSGSLVDWTPRIPAQRQV